MIDFLSDTPWVLQAGFILGGFVIGILAELILVRTFKALAKRTKSAWDDLLVEGLHRMPIVWGTAAGLWGAMLVRDVDPYIRVILEKVLIAVIIASLTLVAMRWASGAVDQYTSRGGARVTSTTLVNNLIKLLIFTLGLFLILQNLNIEITALITALGIGGLAVALALQDTLANLFAGISIILSRQIRPNDYLQLSGGEEGFVTDVKARNTTIRTFPSRNLVVIPNNVLASSIVTNLSLPKASLWITVRVGVSYDDDLEEVERVAVEVAEQTLEAVTGKVPGESPHLRYRAFGDSSIDFDVLLPANKFADQFLIRHEFIKRLHARFKEEGIEIPFPIRTLVMSKKENSDAGDTSETSL
ncbi:MAG: mechanosensitive ion channel family protein [Rhodothermia bacterium]|nr:MAG: mechanosensitive ion channel family protein [Rhodothermia bacterium]